MKFGLIENREVEKVQIENEYLKAEIMTLGATLLSFTDKASNTDIVLGFDDLEGYLNQHGSYLGAAVGRCANRIKNGKFILNGSEVQVSVNDGENSLHGGIHGLSFQICDIVDLKNDSVTMKYHFKDGEEGYPGNVELLITYRLHNRDLEFEIEGQSDQDTILNITNHSYFNLDGIHSKSILDHELKIYSGQVALVDEGGCTLEEVIDVNETGFDFREFKKIKDQLKKSHPNLEAAGGYDHNYVFETLEYKKMAVLRNEKLQLEIFSDYPGMHVYSGNFLDGQCAGKSGNFYIKHNGICFECQYAPNAVNYSSFIKPILRKGEVMKHKICFRLIKAE